MPGKRLFPDAGHLPFQTHMLIYGIVVRVMLDTGPHPMGRLIPIRVVDQQLYGLPTGQLMALQLKASVFVSIEFPRGSNGPIIVGKQFAGRFKIVQHAVQFTVKLLFVRIHFIDELNLMWVDHIATLHEVLPDRVFYFPQSEVSLARIHMYFPFLRDDGCT